MPNILIVTNRDDAHADLIIQKLNSSGQGGAVARINTEDFSSNSTVYFDGSRIEVQLYDSERHISTDGITSVWYRRPMPVVHETSLQNRYVSNYIEKQYEAFLGGLYAQTHRSALWVNPLPSLRISKFKLSQLSAAQESGLRVPPTIITNKYEKVLEFAERYESFCTKSLADLNILGDDFTYPFLTRRISRDFIAENLASIKHAPTLIQKYIEKKFDIRVIVIGSKVFAFEIHSQENSNSETDFKGAPPHDILHKSHTLPEDIEKKIIDFVRGQKLIFSAIDLVLSKDEEYIFLENNPNGQWMWLEIITEIDMSSSLIEILEKGFFN